MPARSILQIPGQFELHSEIFILKKKKKSKAEIRARNEVVERLTLWMGEERGRLIPRTNLL